MKILKILVLFVFMTSCLEVIAQKKKNAKNVIHVTEDSIQMASSTCDNQLCVTEGVVTLENKASRVQGNYIICLPNGVTLELLNDEEKNGDFATFSSRSAFLQHA